MYGEMTSNALESFAQKTKNNYNYKQNLLQIQDTTSLCY